jgi:hypothetical protein
VTRRPIDDDQFTRRAWIIVFISLGCGVVFIAAMIFLMVRLALRLAP